MLLETTVETTCCESTNIGAADTDLIEKGISVTTKKEGRLIIVGHPLIDLR